MTFAAGAGRRPSGATALVVAVLIAACGSPAAVDVESPPGDASTGAATPSPSPTDTATPEPSPEPSPSPVPSVGPRTLFGVWRTTLAGQPVSLSLSETTYRIVRAPNVGTGSVSVTGDLIEFFDSSICPGTGVYRWEIGEDGALEFFPVETEPCPGRAEALLLRYPDYSPPRNP
jgi:hypothetical protein